jgi:hypothetical protein
VFRRLTLKNVDLLVENMSISGEIISKFEVSVNVGHILSFELFAVMVLEL